MSESTTTFVIIKNRLTSAMPMLRIKNKYYEIKIYYSGDYTNDFENNSIDPLKIKCITKPLNTKNKVLIDPVNNAADITLLTSMVTADEIEGARKQLKIAELSLQEIKTIISEYFQIN